LTVTVNKYNEDCAGAVKTTESVAYELITGIAKLYPMNVRDDTNVLAATLTVKLNPH